MNAWVESRCATRGAGVAACVRGLGLVCLLGAAQGCLVTDTIDFPEEANVPPVITSAPGAVNPLNRFVRVDLDEVVDGGSNELRFDVLVRDENVSQRLEAKVFLNYRPEFASPDQELGYFQIPATGSVTRSASFAVIRDRVRPAGECHKLELLVSGRFEFEAGSRNPEIPDDIAQAVWWIATTDRESPVVDARGCQ